ncbi:MAG: glycosyltransferase family 39 protein [Gemmatimonadetes bacterium]|nr:glycosyltransferase family 39 protein [Gemmatimonadota bacterium]MCC6769659.1 glycosyltransferase family 39 protein [Gemmatimonadaceae bacterium]
MRAAALVMAVLGAFPLANWIAGGHEYENYAQVRSEWATGALIVFGFAAVLTILSRRLPLWRPGLFSGIVHAAHAHPVRTGVLLFATTLAVYVVVALWVLSGRPLLIDEIGHIFQARIFAQGRLWLDPPQYPEFFSALHVIDFGGKYYAHFPPGGPLLMLPAVVLGIPWIVGPLFGAISATLFWALVRRIESRPAVALAAALLFAFAPFVAFLSGSHMNHVPVLTCLLLAMYALVRQTDDDAPHPGWGALCGGALGVAASLRPLDAVAFALPAGLWMLWRTIQRKSRFPELMTAGIAITLPIAGVLWYNSQATGQPLVFPYELLWGKSHGLGFHAAPWGEPHSPLRGLELLNIYFLRLQTNLFELPVPSLIAPIVALAATRRVERFDRYLLWTAGGIVALYFSYWGDGFFLGSRFFLVLAPALALWSARCLPALRERFPSATTLYRGAVFAAASALAIAVLVGIPYRAFVYRNGFLSMRLDLPEMAERQGVRDAIIFVREGWGSQLIARMWALGVPRSETESIYRAVDACVLDHALQRLERSTVRDSAAWQQLQPLMRDSLRLEKGTLTPDRTLRSLPGSTYDTECTARVMEDRAGFTVGTSVLANAPSSNIFARDLHGRDTLLVQQFPGRPLFLLRPTSSELGAPLVLEPLRPDSVARSWGVSMPAHEAADVPSQIR